MNNELKTDLCISFQWLSDRKKRALQKKDVGEFSHYRALADSRLHVYNVQVQRETLY